MSICHFGSEALLSPRTPHITNDGMRCCRSDQPWLCLFCCYQRLCVVSQQSWFWTFLFHKFSNFTPPPHSPPTAPPPYNTTTTLKEVCMWSTLIRRPKTSTTQCLLVGAFILWWWCVFIYQNIECPKCSTVIWLLLFVPCPLWQIQGLNFIFLFFPLCTFNMVVSVAFFFCYNPRILFLIRPELC